MNFLGRWLSDSITIASALLFAILAMQAPTFTQDYASALLQVWQDSRRDIDQRMASAHQFYGIAAESDDQFVAALKAFEPSNAQTLAMSLDRAHALQSAYDRITRSRLLLQPFTAVRDALDDDRGYKAAIWRTLLGTYSVQVSFSAAAGAYAFGGLLFGSLVAQLLLSTCRGAARRLGGSRHRSIVQDVASRRRSPS